MAKHRSRKRKKGANRRSIAPGKRASNESRKKKKDRSSRSSIAPQETNKTEATEAAEAEQQKRDSQAPNDQQQLPAGSSEADDKGQAAPPSKQSDQASFSSAGNEEKRAEEASSESKSQPAEEAKTDSEKKPDETDEQPRSSQASDESGAGESSDHDARDSKPPQSKKEDGDSKAESDGESDATDDDGFHDEFFLQGERVEAEHLAEREKLSKGLVEPEPELEQVDHRSLRIMAPDVVARRKKMRRYVALGLAPLVVIASVAAAKIFQSSASAHDNEASAFSAQASAPATTPPEKSSPTQTTTAPLASASSASSSEPEARLLDGGADALPDAQPGQDASDAAEMSSGDGAAGDGAAEDVLDAGAADSADAGRKGEDSGDEATTSDEFEGVNVRKEALKALNRGKWKDALRYSRAALQRDPSDATLYLYLGTALQETGKVKEARKVYSECVHKATKGPKHECRAMGGR